MSANKLVFATNNSNKLYEVQNVLGNDFQLLNLNDINCSVEIPETHETIEENALEKAQYIFNNFKSNCFADDTGLEVEALNNRPGVYSARYAGEEKDSNANMDKILKELDGIENRKARFRTVVALIIDGKKMLFEGIVNGKIISEKRGERGFGYDPIFVADGYSKTFAELPIEEKNKISHRALAINKLVEYLKSNAGIFK